MKENKYFKKAEFECKCGKCQLPPGMPSDELIDVLCEIREHFGKPIRINSGYRCEIHNARVGGAKKSRHIVGDAADFIVIGVPTKDVYRHVIEKYDDRPYGVAISINNSDKNAGFVHLDTRGYRARWSYNKAGELFLAELKREMGSGNANKA